MFGPATTDIRINYATFTRMACHSGAVVGSDGSLKRTAETPGAVTYNTPNPPLTAGMPGSLDVFGAGGAALCDPSTCDPHTPGVLPPLPSPADIPAAWQQIEWQIPPIDR